MRGFSVFGAVAVLTLFVAMFAAGCGDDDYQPYDVVGAECRFDLDCAPGVGCEQGKEFGDGTCALSCDDHFDCPGGAACIDTKGGYCLISCNDDSWCRPGFHCKAKHNRSGSGDSFVCVNLS